MLKRAASKCETSQLSNFQNAGADRFVRGAHHRRCAREGLTAPMMPYGYALLQAGERFVSSECRIYFVSVIYFGCGTQNYAGRFMSDANSSSSFCHSTGFTRCSSKPASRERCRSDSCPYPVMAINRISFSSGVWRSCFATS